MTESRTGAAAGERTTAGPGAGWLWALIGAAVLTQAATNLARPVTSYHLLALGAPDAAVGLATVAYALLPLVGALWLGRVTDRLSSAAPLVVAGAAVLAAGAAGLALATDVAAVLAASAVLGVGHLAFTIAGQAAIARRAPAHLLDGAFGWFTAAFSLGQMLGPLLSGGILTAAGGTPRDATTLALWVAAGLALAGALPVLLAPGAPPGTRDPAAREASAESGVPPGDDAGRPTVRAILARPGVGSAMLASLALLAVLDILTAFLPVVGERHGVSAAWVGALLALRGAGSLVSRVFLPRLRRRLSRELLLAVALWASAATIAAVPVGMTSGLLWLAAAAAVAGGLTLGVGQPLTMSVISEAVPHAWRSTALAVRLMGNRLGQVVLPAAAGLAAAPLGPSAAVWTACAVLAVSGVGRAARSRRRRPPRSVRSGGGRGGSAPADQ